MLEPGSKIYKCRRRKGLSQAELASRAGIAQANLSNIENGKRDLTVSTLLRIAQALEIKPSSLIDEQIVKPFKLTRRQIETIAAMVLNPKAKASVEIKQLAGDFRCILPDIGRRISSKKAQLAWMDLKRKLSSQEIKGIGQRVEDGRQRAKSSKAPAQKFRYNQIPD